MSFPAYADTRSGAHIRTYLQGAFGPLDKNHPFLVSLLYALDRFEHRDFLQTFARGNALLICDRYVASNIAHQGAKLEDWRPVAEQIQQIEHGVLGLPRPDLTILLDIPAEDSFRRTHARDADPDLHQDNIEYMRRVRQIYLELARTDPNWHVVKCLSEDHRDRTAEAINDEIWGIVSQSF
jgi:dTMP kinase